MELEALPLANPSGQLTDRPTTLFGPFVDRAGRLLRFVAFECPAQLSVVVQPLVSSDETVLMIPFGAEPDPANAQSWTLPAGTVWIRARFLAAGAAGFAGLRIASGTLQFTGVVAHDQSRIFLQGLASSWTLSVEPEQPDAPAPGSDAAAVALTLPARLIVRSGAPAEVSGPGTLSGFGSDLTFAPIPAPPSFAGGFCSFPLTPAEPSWTIAQNRSESAQVSGTAQISSSAWALPVSNLGPGALTEAPHGGSFVVRLNGVLRSTFAGQGGQAFTWFASMLTVNARRVELDGLQVAPGGRGEIELWSKSTSSFVFAGEPIQRLLFRSERDGVDAAAIRGGRQRNHWDLPRQSDGLPFAFEGVIDTFGLIASADGFVLTCLASAEPPSQSTGLALENLYVVVRAPKRCALVAAFIPESRTAPAGLSFLFFDACFALPTLPDPYAANTTLVDRGDTFQESLRVELRWIGSQRPQVLVHLDGDVRFARSLTPPADSDEEREVSSLFRGYLDAATEALYLLDISSREHLFGVAFETPDEARPAIEDNRLAMPLHRVRLFLQPQVQWEPVWIQPNPAVPALKEGLVRSLSNGGPTFVAARGDMLVATLPAPLSNQILEAIRSQKRAAALFSLPFGLRAVARLSPNDSAPNQIAPSIVDTSLHEPDFGTLRSAQQIRLSARNTRLTLGEDPARRMPGKLRQLKNLNPDNPSGLDSVLPSDLREALNVSFTETIPLHRADLSGYGLTAFSEWCLQQDAGITKVHFEVMNGRTSYEVIEFRSALYECGARVVRTITIERRNSASVVLADSGWVPLEDGLFEKPVPFEKGAITAFRNIRRIRITGPSFDIGPGAAVQPVVFDADAEIQGLEGGGFANTVPILDRPGYVQVEPPPPVPANLLQPAQLQALFAKVGPITSAVDCRARLADALGLEVSSITSDFAPDDGNGIGFAVAAVGNPRLPRAGQWSAVRIDPATSEALPVDPRRGVPVVRSGANPFVFREPSDARRSQAKIRYGLLMSTQGSRALFPEPRIDPDNPRRIACDPPLLADPYSLVQSSAAFPRAAYSLKLTEAAAFAVTGDAWRIEQPEFTFADPNRDLLKGGEWELTRGYDHGEKIQLVVDSAATIPWSVAIPPSTIDVDLPMLPEPLRRIFQIRTNYAAASGGSPKLVKPTLEFIGALKDVKDIVDTLSKLANLGFDFDVNVTGAGSGTNPSFLVQMQLVFRLGSPTDRVDIGVGKFFGQFLINGNLEVGTSGVDRPRLFLEFQGDIQQGILPPLLYAGGLFRFGIDIPATGSPVVQLAMGIVASIGGDLIPGLLAVEVTVKYGYTLIPETLEPGVLLGLDARAKLLGGLVGFSFGVEAMARIKRVDQSGVRVWAHIRVAASVQVALFVEEDVDFETQFEQVIPLELAAVLPGGQLVGLAAALSKA
jgi:hypothetical protein